MKVSKDLREHIEAQVRAKAAPQEGRCGMRRLVNWILGRRCESCAHWRAVWTMATPSSRFAMGKCRREPFVSLALVDGREPFVSLALEDGRERACEHWRSREAPSREKPKGGAK